MSLSFTLFLSLSTGLSGQTRLDHADEGGMMDASRFGLAAVDTVTGEDIKLAGRHQEQVRAELNRVLNSSSFDASERNRRFMSYVVEEALIGRGDRIKAYTIATVVFGRDDSFDPTLDPVVRMEARRLRRSLERFYLVEGEIGPIRITLPKGGYVPQFQPAGAVNLHEGPVRMGEPRVSFRGPSVFVSAFELEYSHWRDVSFCDGLARQIVITLSHIPELTIFMPRPAAGFDPHSGLAPGTLEFDFFLAGNVVASAEVLKVKATLLDARTGRVVRAETFVGDTVTYDLLEERDRIAEDIARQLSGYITVNRDLGSR